MNSFSFEDVVFLLVAAAILLIAIFQMLRKPAELPLLTKTHVETQVGRRPRKSEQSQGSATVDRLAKYARHAATLNHCLEEGRRLADYEGAESDSRMTIMADVITVIREIALPNDAIRTTDAENLISFCNKAGISELAWRSPKQMADFLKACESNSRLHSLVFLSSANSGQTKHLRGLLIAFAEETATRPAVVGPRRANAYARILQGLREEYLTADEIAENAGRSEDDAESPAAKELGTFVAETKELDEAFRQAASTPGSQIDPSMGMNFVVLADISFITHEVAKASDEVRSEDVSRLRMYCVQAAVPVFATADEEVIDRILARGPLHTQLLSLCILKGVSSPYLARLRQLLTAYAEETAGQNDKVRPLRADAGRRMVARIRTESFVEPDDRGHEEVATESLCMELFGLPANSTAQELKRAYHQKVAMWHPDKLQGMAPELVNMANQELAKINAGYATITRTASPR